MATAYLGLGSNLGDRAEMLSFARRRLGELGVHTTGASGIEETEPVGVLDQPRFLNQVLQVETTVPPRELLELVKGVEREAGRGDGPRWGPRELDIDILAYGGLSVDEPGLTIPHPAVAERDFVLRELRQLDPALADTFGRPG